VWSVLTLSSCAIKQLQVLAMSFLWNFLKVIFAKPVDIAKNAIEAAKKSFLMYYY